MGIKKANDYKKVVFKNDNNVKIVIDKKDKNASKRFVNYSLNHETLFRKINMFLIEKKIIKNNFIDLGAWLGDNAIPWALNCKDSIIYAIDPSPHNCDYIRKQVELNKISNIVIIEKAISDKDETISTDGNIDHCSFKMSNKGKTKIAAISLDKLFEEGVINNIGYMHLDVEGMESKVIHGAENIIKTLKPVITFEQHTEKDNYKELCMYLKNLGYEIYSINEICGHRHDCRNFLALPKEVLKKGLIDDIHKYIKRYDILRKE